MLKTICKFIYKRLGWTGNGLIPPEKKCIVIGAPHTSAWDFVMSYLYYTSIGGKMNVVIKKEFFFWPLGYFLKKMGGYPIDRSKGANVIRQIVNLYNENEHFHMALTPEGTRKWNKRWKAGFHSIAKQTGATVYVGTFDWGRKEVNIWEPFELTDNAQEDIKRLKRYYREKGVKGKFPESFCTEE